MRKIAEDFDFIETPDKRGMYKYHDKKRAYIEILSFDKSIDDAGKRNRIASNMYGNPSSVYAFGRKTKKF